MTERFYSSQGFALRGEFLSPAMGKKPKDRRGTPQGRTSFAMPAFPQAPHYGSHLFDRT